MAQDDIDTEARRRQLRATFDEDALLYDQARPGYPPAMLDDIVALSGMPPGGHILEIGPGTGQVTLPWARRGYRVTAIELGASMAAVARQKLAGFAGVEIVTGTFESWPLAPGTFDLVFSATAFHWIEPAVRYRKSAEVLAPGGTLALCWNKHVDVPDSGGFFEATEPFYQEAFPGHVYHGARMPPEDQPAPEQIEIEESGLFGPVAARRYIWQQAYDVESYIALLSTYSDHRSLPPDRRARLFEQIAGLMRADYGGRIVKGYLTALFCARSLSV
ncbi:MAG TPA: class I SAM-dependent methyltransferase [Kouleothrix sp.]|uniref:class I SAM-dependent methyltransferase n=1 Tax=Kouleothrix sp. TaxID=2779161 RepID=UPI002BD0554D|nr:class I SAM-dependent methyltransferase [Kouleothrix sp.]